jgi:amino acid adenylation domain-containing protein
VLLHDFLAQTVERTPEATALVCEGRRVSYRVLAGRAWRLAATLQAQGVVKGDRVAILLDNSVEAVVAIYAALAAGAVFMPVSPQVKTDKLRYLLADARPTCLITHAHLERVWAPALADADSVRACIVAGGASAAAPRAGLSVLDFDDATAAPGGRPSDRGLIDQDLAGLIYTSGSTGDAKGVMLTHLNMVSACTSIRTYLGLRAGDVILGALPLSFTYGLYQILLAAGVGATVVLERSFAFPVKTLEVMVREGVTVFPGVPTMFATLLGLDSLGQHDLRRLRMVTNAAAALPEEHIRRMRQGFPQATVFSMYGLTECTRVSYLPPDQLDTRPGSVGRGMPNEEWWLVDNAGARLPFGSTGELVVRGSHVMRGYWNKPAATARRLQPGPMPGEVVLCTGDVFRTDAEGYLYFVARKDDIIKSRGERVSPKEIETQLFGLKGVREAAVIGVDDAVLGQAVKAFVALDPGCSYTERDVIKYCRERFENHMVPKYVAFMPELPKTVTGKIDKLALR